MSEKDAEVLVVEDNKPEEDESSQDEGVTPINPQTGRPTRTRRAPAFSSSIPVSIRRVAKKANKAQTTPKKRGPKPKPKEAAQLIPNNAFDYDKLAEKLDSLIEKKLSVKIDSLQDLLKRIGDQEEEDDYTRDFTGPGVNPSPLFDPTPVIGHRNTPVQRSTTQQVPDPIQGYIQQPQIIPPQVIIQQTVKPLEPPKFTGDLDEAIRWLIGYKEVTRMNHWNEQLKLEQLDRALEKGAKSWYRNTWNFKVPSTWNEFEREFKITFTRGEISDYLIEKLRTLRQGKNEGLYEYFHTSMELCNMIDNQMADCQKVNYIITGMQPEPKKIIRMVNPPTCILLGEAIKNYLSVYSKTKEESKEDNKGNNTYDKPKKGQNSTQPGHNKENNWCFGCGQKGHYYRGCPKPQAQEVINKRREAWRLNPPWTTKSRDNNRANTAIMNHPEDPNFSREQDSTDDCSESIGNKDPLSGKWVKVYRPPEGLDPPDTMKLRSIKHIGSIHKDSASKITCRVNGQLEEACLDTGATVTIIPLSIIESTKTPIYEWTGRSLTLADGGQQTPLGWSIVSIEYQDRIYTVSAVVLANAPEILIGEDYTTKAGLIISYHDNLTTYHDKYMKITEELFKRIAPKTTDVISQTVEVSTICQQVPQAKAMQLDKSEVNEAPTLKNYHIEYIGDKKPALKVGRAKLNCESPEIFQYMNVRSKRRITIPPRSKARIEVKTSGKKPKPYLIEPEPNSLIRALPGIGRRLASVIEVINVSKQPVTIDRRQHIARATLLEDSLDDEPIKLPGNLSKVQEEKLKSLIDKHKPLFVTQNEAIGIVPFMKHEIDTSNADPIRSKPYRVSLKEQHVIQDLVQEMLDADIIRPSKSHWSSPIVLVKKKGTSDLRFCVDYRKLNKVTKVDPYPIPNMDAVLETLTGNHWFSKLDVKSMYWQVQMDEASRCKTAFVVHCGQYEFNVMPFGLVSAPMTAMRVMNEVTKGLNDTCFVFYDDILVFTPTFEKHLNALEQLFQRFSTANIKLNAKKCDLLLNSISYLGHLVTPEGIEPDPEKIKSVKMFKTPTTITEARSFIGLCNFFRRFIKGFADIARPIHDTITTKKPFSWTKNAQKAMDELKDKLTSPPVLAHFDPTGNLTIRCDASGYGLGAVLKQESPDQGKTGVVAYTSRTLVGAEKNYATTHKECLAAVHAVKHWRHYLYGKHFTIITDHHALCWLMKNKDHTGQLIRWSLILQEFDFTIQYESGKLHADADCLSRYPLEADKTAIEESDIPSWPIHKINLSKSTVYLANHKLDELFLPVYDIEREQLQDSFSSSIINALHQSNKKGKRKYKHFIIKDKILYRRSKQDKTKYLLILPSSMKNYVLKETHDQPIGGHFGIKRTIDTIRKRFYWQTLDHDVKTYVSSCDLCQKKKTHCRKKEGLLIPMPIPNQPFEIIGMDLMGPLPSSSNRYEYIVVITDYLTKYVVAQPLRKATTDRIIELIKKYIFYTHGLPSTIITDNGTNLTSNKMRELLQLLKIQHKTTSPYRPQTNGQTERYNRVLGTQLTIFAEGKPKTWDSYMDALVFAYNTTIHTSHLNTPYQLVFGRQPIKPIDRAIGRPLQVPVKDNPADITEQDILLEARKLAKHLVQTSQLKAKLRYDKGRVKPKYKVNDLVLRHKPRLLGERKKFSLPWIGPYKIIKVLNEVNYQIISLKDSSDEHIVHASQIKPYNTRRVEELEEERIAEASQDLDDDTRSDVKEPELICIDSVKLN